jgi:hypothetical protein
MEQRWRLTGLLHLLQTGINLLRTVTWRFHMPDQELMNLHVEDLVGRPMLLPVEVEGMVEVVTMMDHHLALHVPLLGEDFQRIGGALEVVGRVVLIVNEVAGMMSDQIFGGEVPAMRHLHDSLRNRLLSSGCAYLASLAISVFVHKAGWKSWEYT